jgi:aminopeptidase YwaD
VIARLPATIAGPADVVVLGAHFDGVPVGPAAADDGTGVALVVAAARHFAAVDCREVELMFALFDEEEKGLLGSRHVAAGLVERGEPVRAVHVFDMISFDGDRDGAAELWSPAPALAARYRAAGEALGVPIREVEFSSSDHQPFVELGLPVTGVSEEFVSGDHTPHYHQPTDTVDNVDLAYLAAVSRLALAAVSLDVTGP